MSTQTWEYLANNDYAKTSETFIDNTNSDIVVLKDIFSASSADTKYSSNININITAEDNSPVCLSGAVTVGILLKIVRSYILLVLNLQEKD
jgi:hypothetical protein